MEASWQEGEDICVLERKSWISPAHVHWPPTIITHQQNVKKKQELAARKKCTCQLQRSHNTQSSSYNAHSNSSPLAWENQSAFRKDQERRIISLWSDGKLWEVELSLEGWLRSGSSAHHLILPYAPCGQPFRCETEYANSYVKYKHSQTSGHSHEKLDVLYSKEHKSKRVLYWLLIVWHNFIGTCRISGIKVLAHVNSILNRWVKGMEWKGKMLH